MHELSLCKSILSIIEQTAKNTGKNKVKLICLEIGDEAAIDQNSLTFYFSFVSKGTIAENAKLKIEKTEGFELKVKYMEAENV